MNVNTIVKSSFESNTREAGCLTYSFILSVFPSGYPQITLNSRHCRQAGVSPLHFVLRCLQEWQARGTLRMARGGVLYCSLGIAIFARLSSFVSASLDVELNLSVPCDDKDIPTGGFDMEITLSSIGCCERSVDSGLMLSFFV